MSEQDKIRLEQIRQLQFEHLQYAHQKSLAETGGYIEYMMEKIQKELREYQPKTNQIPEDVIFENKSKRSEEERVKHNERCRKYYHRNKEKLLQSQKVRRAKNENQH